MATLLLLRLQALRAVKTEPLSPKTGEYDFAYASDVVENNGCDPGRIVELSF
jgi:hypothetical protein